MPGPARLLLLCAGLSLLATGCVRSTPPDDVRASVAAHDGAGRSTGESGGSSGTAPVVDQAASTADPDDAVDQLETYLEAVATGDDAGCDLETPAYSRRANEEIGQLAGEDAEPPDCPERFLQTYLILVAFDLDLSGTVYTLRPSSTSGEATVDVSYPDGTEETYVLTVEGGTWLVDESSTTSGGEGATETGSG